MASRVYGSLRAELPVPGGLSLVVAGTGACLMSAPPHRPAQPVAEVPDRAGPTGPLLRSRSPRTQQCHTSHYGIGIDEIAPAPEQPEWSWTVQPEGSGPTRIRKVQGSNPSSGSISSVKGYQARRADLDEINSGNLSVLTTGAVKECGLSGPDLQRPKIA